MTADLKRDIIVAKAVVVSGDNIDTDEIIPARFLKTVDFQSLANQAFADARDAAKKHGSIHPLDDPQFKDAQILISGSNFGCGSSREHAPQALIRWNKGIKTIIARSYSEIFFGNCVAMGIPCFVIGADDAQKLEQQCVQTPSQDFTVNVQAATIEFENTVIQLGMDESIRRQFVEGRWDSTSNLLMSIEQIKQTKALLPYINGWK